MRQAIISTNADPILRGIHFFFQKIKSTKHHWVNPIIPEFQEVLIHEIFNEWWICLPNGMDYQFHPMSEANLRDLIAATCLVILLKIGFKSSIFRSMSPSNLMDDLKKKQWNTSSVLRQALCIISNPLVKSNCSYSPETLNLDQNWRFSVLYDLEIWWMTLANNRAHLLCYLKLCESFQSHRWIQTGVTVRKR